jgi:hypothetical protein
MLSDDAAVADLGDAPAYAEVLLDVAASARSAPMAIAMARAPRLFAAASNVYWRAPRRRLSAEVNGYRFRSASFH